MTAVSVGSDMDVERNEVHARVTTSLLRHTAVNSTGIAASAGPSVLKSYKIPKRNIEAGGILDFRLVNYLDMTAGTPSVNFSLILATTAGGTTGTALSQSITFTADSSIVYDGTIAVHTNTLVTVFSNTFYGSNTAAGANRCHRGNNITVSDLEDTDYYINIVYDEGNFGGTHTANLYAHSGIIRIN
jgi:hypothetical protein